MKALSEKKVVAIWQDCVAGRDDLLTEDGELIKIIYPGRINDDRGGDLRDAVIATAGGLSRGDIEVHTKSSGWRSHGHHLDPAYNGVILHVVYWPDTKELVTLQNGQTIPTLALNRYLSPELSRRRYANRPLSHCHAMSRSDGRVLDAAGEARLMANADRFQASLAQTEAGQSLYQGIMTALGYARNKMPMLELSRRMPLKRLGVNASGGMDDDEFLICQQALLMGTAGLLPSQRSGCPGKRDNEWTEKVERFWSSCYLAETMSEDDWHFFKVRPGNFPTRRLAAMSHLLLRFREKGLLRETVNRLIEAPVDGNCIGLKELFRVKTGDYWAERLDFGMPARMSMPALIGDGRAADIVVNVLLPFAIAWSSLNGLPEVASKACSFYRLYPRLAENSLEKHMRDQLGISRHLVDSACRQQGLIHIYKSLCTQGKCGECPLNAGK